MIANPRILSSQAEKKDLFSHFSGPLPSIKALVICVLFLLVLLPNMTAAEDAAAALAAGGDVPVAASELELATATALVNAINPKTPIRWVSNPNQGDINPGTSEGAKRFKAATTPLAEEKRLSIKVENAVKVISHFKHEAQLNSWQDAVTINVGTLAVPIIKDIFDHHRDITLDQLKDNAWKSFGDDPAVVRIKTDPLNAK
eukprot:scaffold5441_cov62-Attheya_sp.AAC.1